MSRRTLLVLAALAAGLLGPARASRGGRLSGTATTVVRAFDLVQEIDGIQRVRRYRPVDQYLNLSWRDLGAREAFGVDLSLRGRIDLATGGAGGDDDLDVLQASFEWRSAGRRTSVRVGRQQALTGLGWHAFDGVRVSLGRGAARGAVHLGATVDRFGNGASASDGLTYGAELRLGVAGTAVVGLDYESRERGGVRTEETAGLDVAFLRGGTTIVANTDYSVLLDRFGETSALLRQRIAPRQHLEASFSRVEPVLPADQILAVFATNPHDHARIAWEMSTRRGLVVGAFFANEDYVKTPFPGPEDIQRAAATVSFLTRHGGDHRGEIGWQHGFSGSRLGLRFDSDWDASPRLRLGVGGSLQRYENAYRLAEEDETWALRARLAHEHDGRWSIALELEQFVGRDRDTLRGALVFSTKIGAARSERPWWGGRFGEAWEPSSPPRRERPAAPPLEETAR